MEERVGVEMSNNLEVLYFEKSSLGRATLNAPTSLNSLTLNMVNSLHSKFAKEWHTANHNVKAIFLDGAGDKAFCAGGDVRKLYEAMKAKDTVYPENFFRSEYTLDYSIHTSPKPTLVWGHGFVMGGGLGLMAGASHRIVTEKTALSMPEITIGLYPDVGASHFLHKAPGKLGLFCGLTGARLNAHDALYMRLGDFFIPNSERESIFDDLSHLPLKGERSSDSQSISHLLLKRSQDFHSLLPESELKKHQEIIEKQIMTSDDLTTIAANFERVATQSLWLEKTFQIFRKGCPMSHAVIMEQFRRSKGKSLNDCFEMEYQMSQRFAERPDFQEGVRALLIDKDQNPQWSAKSWGEISQLEVMAHFETKGRNLFS